MSRERDLESNLVEDQGGAVILIGVFVALALTASLWFMIGIGDAIAFRETAQEATDAATFSSGVVHARSMNFIAAINLVMLGATVVYLVLAIIADLLQVAFIACTTVAFKACSYGTYGAVPAALEAAQQVAQEAADSYKNGVLTTIYKSGDQLQKLVARTAPWTASFAANRVAKRYERDLTTSTLGLSNAPSIDGGSGTAGSGTKKDETRLGLPVTAVKAEKLCDRVFSGAALGPWVEKNSGQDFARGFAALGSAVSAAAQSAGTSRYCDGNPFNQDGPKYVLSSAQNGSDYMQVYGFTLGAKLKDKNKSDQAVGSLARTKRKVQTSAPKSNVYLSQTEFFFDCTSTWDTTSCNKDDSALFSPRWKARMRRMRTPVAGAALGSQAMSLLTSGAVSIAGQALGVPELDETIQSVTDLANGDAGSILSNQISAFFNAPPIPLSIPLPQAGDALKKFPVPGYFH